MADDRPAKETRDVEVEPTRSPDIWLPEPSPEDVAALRKARRLPMDPEQIWRFLRTMEGPTVEQLRRRPVTRGEPFRWVED